ncbi:MAG: L,D-transpeptidase family protein [Porticoccaceae bacterium]
MTTLVLCALAVFSLALRVGDSFAVTQPGKGAAVGAITDATATADPMQQSGFYDLNKLRLLLARTERMEADGPWPRLEGPVKLEIGNSDRRVAVLRRQLLRLGDFPTVAIGGDAFDVVLEDAVKAFQARHGLLADGVVGPASRRALNQTPGERVARTKLNLERLRNLHFEARHIVVNIPALELVAMDNGRVALRSAVVVGRPSRPTPVMADQMLNLVLSPTWTPTPMIARLDILPKLRTDPGYLVRNQIRLFDSWAADAREINPFLVDWSRVRPEQSHYRFRQDPGPSNSLGQIRFSLANDADIYLHDTPHRELFEKPRRAFSSGCVRVADARVLALFALDANGDWSAERLEAVIATRTKQVIKLAKPLPIHLIYVTVWVDERGVAQFRDDIYGQDVYGQGLSLAAAPDSNR